MPTTPLIIPPDRDTFVETIAQLQAALTTAKTDAEKRSIKTAMEQAAGREAIKKGAREQKVLAGKEELQRRFGDRSVLAASWALRENEFWVDVIVQPADGSMPMTFTEQLVIFPSDDCIANIALVT